jgi:D-3-phosphoglycerate dehydrogenase
MTASAARILVAEPQDFSPRAVEILRQVAEVELRDCAPAELAGALKHYDVVWFRLTHRVDRAALAAAGSDLRCRIVATPVTGLDHVDLDACAECGVRVVSLRGESEFLRTIRATAELTIAAFLALARKLPRASRSVLDGMWDRDRFRGQELHGKRVGMVGMGRLGTIVAGLLRAFGMDVCGHDPRPDFPTEAATRVETLDELLAMSDVVSLHVPYGPGTRHLIGRAEFARMRRGALLVNTSRGGVLDQVALLEALESGHLGGAALDVLEGEPRPHDHAASRALVEYAKTHGNLVIGPHIGGNTAESFARTEVFLAGGVVEALG